MTAYIANHKKKLNTLKKRETELSHAIRHNAGEDRLHKCAERLRAAQLAVLKMKYSRDSVLPVNTYKPDEEAKYWIEIDVADIVEIHRKRNKK